MSSERFEQGLLKDKQRSVAAIDTCMKTQSLQIAAAIRSGFGKVTGKDEE
jgi:hypothetical protein